MRFAAKSAFFMAMAVLMSTVSWAQAPDPEGWQFSSLTVSAGEDALSSGIAGSLWMDNQEKHTTFNVVVQQEQAWFLCGRRFTVGKLKGTVAGSTGHFMGVPWIGPYLDLAMPLGTVAGQEVVVSTMQWPIINAWEPDKWKNDGVKNPESLYIGFLTSYQVTVGPVGISYALLNFLDDPWNELPGVSYTQKIRKDFSVMGSVTRNGNAKKWMFYIGATWNPS
ncbi:MAG TPA: hypothetical protein VJ553_03690 [Candidatus Paceibacterota bacterium]|nr:hypothetical protein [Candidatus Paceibacterota bacterium]